MDLALLIRKAGGPSAVGRRVNRTHVTVLRWKRVPDVHARAVADLAGVHPSEVRPDLYDPPAASAGDGRAA